MAATNQSALLSNQVRRFTCRAHTQTHCGRQPAHDDGRQASVGDVLASDIRSLRLTNSDDPVGRTNDESYAQLVQELRAHLVEKMMEKLCPPVSAADTDAECEQQRKVLLKNVKSIENHVFQMAYSTRQYYELLVEKMAEIRREAANLRQK